MTKTVSAELAFRTDAEHAESPRWDPRTDELLWVDVTIGHLHRWSPETGVDRIIEVGGTVAAPAPGGEDGGYAIANRSGFAALSPSGHVTQLADPVAGHADMRMTDSRPDARGRFWGGSIRPQGPFQDGSLYCLDPDGALREVVTGLKMSNGLDWSPDQSTLYFVDSATRGVDAFEFDLAHGTLGARRTAIDLSGQEGFPDGIAVDADGVVWVAMFQGSAVLGFDPDGTLRTRIDLPVSCPTAVAFGGPGLSDLYITTTRFRSPEPLSGNGFVARPGSRGQPPTFFGSPSRAGGA
jgi:sugar lactone lactonase YvrE